MQEWWRCRQAVRLSSKSASIRITAMSKDSDLYGEDIRLWSETQSALLRRLSAGEAVADQIDWPHVVDEIEHSEGGPEHQDEIVHLTARLVAAEALVKELRSRLDDLSSKLGDTKAELATAQDEAEMATARARAAAEAEQAIRQAEAQRRGRGRWARLWAAWRGE
jgi:predicted DNA-binding protein